MAADERQNMKLRTVLALVAVVCSFSASAQVAPHPPFVIDTGPNHRTWQSTRLATDESGQSTLRPSTFVEVASGLNYQDESGIWRASGDLIELADDGGAVALQGPIKVRFNGNLNVPGAISLTTVSNRVFRSHPIGLYYFAADTGQSALIARVKDTVAELHPPNQLVWRDCLEGVKADYRVTYTKAGLEADLILLERLPSPETLGISPRFARLEWFTEWLDMPEPGRRERVLKAESDPVRRAAMVEPDLVEETLDLGDLWFPQGRGFSVDGSEARASDVPATIRIVGSAANGNELLTAKRLLEIDHRRVMVEAVDWLDVEPKLAALPTEKREVRNDQATRGRRLPAARVAKTKSSSIRMARAAYAPRGFLLDYVAVGGSGDFTFASGVTYLIGSGGFFGSTITLQPNCIIKIENGAYLLAYTSIVCNGAGSYSILTSKNDDLYGEPIPGSNGNPTYGASGALWIYFVPSDISVSYLQIRWAQGGINFDANLGDNRSHSAQSIKLQQCQTGIRANGCLVYLSGVTTCGVTTPTFVENGGFFSGVTTVDCAGDTDSDGLLDTWENDWFGNITSQNGTGDPDGDGVNNLQESSLRTDPTSANVDSDGDGLADWYDPNWNTANGAPTLSGQTLPICPQ